MYSLKRQILHAENQLGKKRTGSWQSFDCLCLNRDAFTDACEHSRAECGRINVRTHSRSEKMRPEAASCRVAEEGMKPAGL